MCDELTDPSLLVYNTPILFHLEASMRKAPKDVKAKIDQTVKAWETLAPTARFGGMALGEFEAAVLPSQTTRDTLTTLEQQMTAALDARDAADEVSLTKVQLVVNGVVGDVAFGEDSALYEAMGYVRKSERKSGLTRKGKAKGDQASE